MAAYIKSGDHLAIVFDNGESATVYTSNPRYKDIVVALAAKDYEKVRVLASPVANLQNKIQKVVKRTGAVVELIAGVVYYNGEAIRNSLTDRIVEMSNEGFDIEPMTKFLANLKQNPSFRAVNELYGFLEVGNLPITEDGHFLAYKVVRDDYKDCHSGTFDNSVGKVCEMPRNEVDEDKNRTCSSGLHFCSKGYLSAMGSGRTMILKINPADVVAIPADYNDTKGRTSRYEVIGELGTNESLEGNFRPSPGYVEPTDEDEEDEDDYYEDDYDYWGDNFYGNDDVTEGSIEVKLVEDKDGNIKMVLLDEEFPIEMVDPDTNTVIDQYRTVAEAAADNGVTASAINRVLRGDRLTTGGYAWRSLHPVVTDTTAPHPGNLANMHEHGTLKGGKPHVAVNDEILARYVDHSFYGNEVDDEDYIDEDRPY